MYFGLSPGQPEWAGTRRNITHSHLSWSSVIPYLLPPSITIHGILLFNLHAWQFFPQSLQVFFGLPLGLAPSTSYSIHFFTQSLPSFCSTCPYHRNLFCCSTEIMLSNPSLSLNPLLGTLSCSLMPHIHLIILTSACWSATSFSFLMAQISLPCNVLLCTQLLYNLPLTINDISLLVSIVTKLPNTWIYSIQFEFWSPQLHQHVRLHSTCHLNNKTYPLTPDLHWHQYLHLYILYWIHATSTNQCLHHPVHASLFTTFPTYLLLTTSTLIELLGLHTYSVRAFCFGHRVCRLTRNWGCQARTRRQILCRR